MMHKCDNLSIAETPGVGLMLYSSIFGFVDFEIKIRALKKMRAIVFLNVDPFFQSFSMIHDIFVCSFIYSIIMINQHLPFVLLSLQWNESRPFTSILFR